MISIKHLSKAAVLAALYNASKPQGMGFLQYNPKPMTEAEAEDLLKETTRFDYLKGRVMKIDLKGEEFEPWGYDRDNGEGAAMAVILELGATGNPNSPKHQHIHNEATQESIQKTEAALDTQTTVSKNGDVVAVSMGLSDMKDHLKPALDRAKKT